MNKITQWTIIIGIIVAIIVGTRTIITQENKILINESGQMLISGKLYEARTELQKFTTIKNGTLSEDLSKLKRYADGKASVLDKDFNISISPENLVLHPTDYPSNTQCGEYEVTIQRLTDKKKYIQPNFAISIITPNTDKHLYWETYNKKKEKIILYDEEGNITGYKDKEVVEEIVELDLTNDTQTITMMVCAVEGTSDVFDVEFDFEGTKILFPAPSFQTSTVADWDEGIYINATANSSAVLKLMHGNRSEFDVDGGWANLTGAVAIYHFNNKTAFGENDTNFYDASVYRNNASCPNSKSCPNYTLVDDSYLGRSTLFFQPSNDRHIRIPYSNEAWNFSAMNNFTISWWGQVTTSGDTKTIISMSNYTNSTTRGIRIDRGGSANRPIVYIGNGDNQTALTGWSAYNSFVDYFNVWTFENNGSSWIVKQYRDGAFALNVNTTQTMSITGENIILGSLWTSNTTGYEGYIDELVVLNRTMNITEINKIYTAQKDNYPKGGIYISKVLDAGSSATWNSIQISGSNNNTDHTDSNILNQTGMLLWFRMNNNSGVGENDTRVYDWSGEQNNGTPSGSVQRINTSISKFNGSWYNDGSANNGINVSYDENFNFSADSNESDSSFSVLAWVYLNSSNTNELDIVSFRNDTDYSWFFGGESDGKIYLRLANQTGTLAFWGRNNDPEIYNEWFLVAGTYNGVKNNNGLEVYVRSSTLFVQTTGGGAGTNFAGIRELTGDGKLVVGTSGVTADNMKGFIDELMIWNRTLSVAEINSIYEKGANRHRFQVMSCNDASCSGEVFVGNDNTTNTYFDGTSSITLNTTLTPNNQYFRYSVFLDNDNRDYSPFVKSVNISYTVSEGETVYNTTLPSFYNYTQQGTTTYKFGEVYNLSLTINDTNGTAGIEFNNVNKTTTNTTNWYNTTITGISVGSYNWYGWAYENNDTGTIYNTSTIQTLTITKAYPLVPLSCTTPIIYPTATDCAISETNNGDGDLSYILNITNGVFQVGTLNVNGSTAGGTNYSANSSIFTITINQNTTNAITPLLNEVDANLTIAMPQDFNISFSGSNATQVIMKINGVVSTMHINYSNYTTGNYEIEWNLTGNTNYSQQMYYRNITIIPKLNHPSLIHNVTGVRTEGNITSVITDDLDYWNSTEVTGTPGFEVRFNMTRITSGDGIMMYAWYDGSSGHTVNVQLRNITGSWVTLGTLPDDTQISQHNFSISNFSHYNKTGVLEGRIYHATAGNPTHHLAIDMINLTMLTEEMNPPYFNQTGTNTTIAYEVRYITRINATDDVEIDGYFVNDSRFIMERSTGILENASKLGAGLYYLNVSVNDTSGNYNSTFFWVNVTPLTRTGTLKLGGSQSNQTKDNSTLNYNLSSSITDSEGTMTLRFNESIIHSGQNAISNLTNLTLYVPGIKYPVNVTVPATQNYTAYYQVYFLNITLYVASTPTTGTTATICKYKKLGYYNIKLSWFREQGCL